MYTSDACMCIHPSVNTAFSLPYQIMDDNLNFCIVNLINQIVKPLILVNLNCLFSRKGMWWQDEEPQNKIYSLKRTSSLRISGATKNVMIHWKYTKYNNTSESVKHTPSFDERKPMRDSANGVYDVKIEFSIIQKDLEGAKFESNKSKRHFIQSQIYQFR